MYRDWILLFILLISIAESAFCQSGDNLVPNPSFEQKSCCPTGYSMDINGCLNDWHGMVNHTGSPDYFHECADNPAQNMGVPDNGMGSQDAHEGKAYAGLFLRQIIYTNNTEYLQVRLNEPLVAGQLYNIRMYVNLADKSSIYTHKIGMLLTKDPLNGNGGPGVIDNFNPQAESGIIQDDQGWTEVKNSFVAIGGEEYLTIGVFHFGNSVDDVFSRPEGSIGQSYYYIDDVSVVADVCAHPCPPQLGAISATQRPNSCIPNQAPWCFQVTNAIGYEVTIFDGFGLPFYHFEEYNPNGFVDGFICWNGDCNLNGCSPGTPVQEDVYVYEVRLWNCDQDITLNGTITTFGPHHLPLEILDPITGIPYFNGVTCCEPYRFFQNIDFYSYSRTDVYDFIKAGRNVDNSQPTGGVTVHPGAEVLWRAGNFINLEPGFSVTSGGIFSAVIQHCGASGRLGQQEPSNLATMFIESNELLSINQGDLKVFPNPNNGRFLLIWDSEEIKSIAIISSIGQEIYQTLPISPHASSIELTDLAVGSYLVIVTSISGVSESKRISIVK